MQVEQLTSERYGVNMGGIVDLAKVVKLQTSSATGAARAIWKKLRSSDRPSLSYRWRILWLSPPSALRSDDP